jgi:alkaline phosphatase
MHRFAAAAACFAISIAGSASSAQTIYPIDRAEILSGARFDFKIEFSGLADPAKIAVSLNGQDYAKAFGKTATFIEREDGKDQSALMLRDVSLTRPGSYKIHVTDGVQSREITWNVYGTAPRKAKNVILPHMALVATAGSDSIITDSANSASAYATGHKSAVNAMGVYADRTRDPLDDPKVETITSLVTRQLGMAVGIVTNTEIEDATPAAMVAHVRRRSEYDRIVEQYFAAKPDVLMGGGRANFLAKGTDGSKRKDDADFLARFREAGYSIALTGPEMASAADDPATRRLLGLFTLGNMDGVLDRKFLKGGTVRKFPEQPDLTEQVSAALAVLSRNESGFFLMVESGMIDKYTHLLDMERAVYDTIMLDNAVKLARDWASARGDDTLILVLADHNHPIGLVGTIEDDMSNEAPAAMRERVRVYDRAGFPNYGTADAEGYPSRVDVSRRLALFSASLPDHYETFRPKLDNPNEPTVAGKEPGTYVANERYKSTPGAVFRFGNLPAMINADVHSGEDVILTATGPGSDRVRGQMDNTEVFRVMVEALGLGAATGTDAHGAPASPSDR